jgi:major membrane immunogen (membrane-anchored lipoprotein)
LYFVPQVAVVQAQAAVQTGRHLLEVTKPNKVSTPKGADTAKQAFQRLPKFSRHLLEVTKPNKVSTPKGADTAKQAFQRLPKFSRHLLEVTKPNKASGSCTEEDSACQHSTYLNCA